MIVTKHAAERYLERVLLKRPPFSNDQIASAANALDELIQLATREQHDNKTKREIYRYKDKKINILFMVDDCTVCTVMRDDQYCKQEKYRRNKKKGTSRKGINKS